MVKSVTKKLLLSVVLTGVLFGAVACNGNDQDSNNPKSAQNASNQSNISIVGSTSVHPLVEELSNAYTDKNPNIVFDPQSVGSTAGVKAAFDGTADIGTTSRDLNSEEKTWGLKEHVIAIDGIAVIIHPNNKVSELTSEQVTKIFKGEIKNWKEVGGIDKDILVVSREAGSGTRGAFDELAKVETKKDGKSVSLLRTDALIAEGNGSVKSNVSSKENSIGYLSVGFIDNTLKAPKVNGVDATTDNIKTKKYVYSRAFVVLTKGEEKPEVKNFLTFIDSEEGQAIVKKKYISAK